MRVPGIGKKTAERLIIEMRDKLSELVSSHARVRSGNHRYEQGARHQPLQDAISALISLGYKPQEANRHVTKIDDGQLPAKN